MAKKPGTNPKNEIGTPLLAQSGHRDRAKPSAFGGKTDIALPRALSSSIFWERSS